MPTTHLTVIAIAALLQLGTPAAAEEEGLCTPSLETAKGIVHVVGTIETNMHHGAYLRDDSCSSRQIRLGKLPPQADQSVRSFLQDMYSHAWPHGVTFRVDVEGQLAETPQGTRFLLLQVKSYEIVGGNSE